MSISYKSVIRIKVSFLKSVKFHISFSILSETSIKILNNSLMIY